MGWWSDGTYSGCGKQNTELAAPGSTPGTAIETCANLERDGYGDWWLPSVGEWKKMMDELSVAKRSFLGSDEYWTSTELTSDTYWAYFLKNDVSFYWGSSVKEASRRFCAIRAVTFE